MNSNEEHVLNINQPDISYTTESEQSHDSKIVSQSTNSSEISTTTLQTAEKISSNHINNTSDICVDQKDKCDTSININESNTCESSITSSYKVNSENSSNDITQNVIVHSSTSCENENKLVCDLHDKQLDECDKAANNKNKSKSESSQSQPVVTSALSQLLDYGMSDSEDSESDSVSLSDSGTDSDSSDEIADKPSTDIKPDICGDDKFRNNDSSSDSSTYYDSDSSAGRLV